MINGSKVNLRSILPTEVDKVFELNSDLRHRGEFNSQFIQSLIGFREAAKDGLFGADKGWFIIASKDDQLVGQVGYSRSHDFHSTMSLHFHLYNTELHGKGIMTEAVRLVVNYLFENREINRIQIWTHIKNAPARRVAEKADFKFEGVLRQAYFHKGEYVDASMYSINRSEIFSGR